MSEFSDRPFVAGALTGIRSFKPVDGWLRAPVQGASVWTPGENIAECRPPLGPPLGLKAAPEHQVAAMGCRCGFYAYFHPGYNPHHAYFNILGLIEGYGVATVGSRGFRSSKARIVALIAPDPPVYDLGFVFANYPDVPVFNSVEAAVAEFPLTPPEGTPDPPDSSATPLGIMVNVLPSATSFFRPVKKVLEELNAVAAQSGSSVAKLAEALRESTTATDQPPADVRDRALWLRRNRNTGPAVMRGLDGHRRRS